MASPQLEEVLQKLRSRPTTDSTNIDDSRALSDARKDLFPLDPDVKVSRVSAGGVPAEWIAYEGNPPNAALLVSSRRRICAGFHEEPPLHDILDRQGCGDMRSGPGIPAGP